MLKKAGYNEKAFSSHGLCAGGLTFTEQARVPREMITLLGDWQSNAYERYLENPTKGREAVGLLMHRTILDLGF